MAIRGLMQANEGFSRRCFAATGLAHQPQAFAAKYIQVDAVQGSDIGDFAPKYAAQDREVLLKTFYLQYLLHFYI